VRNADLEATLPCCPACCFLPSLSIGRVPLADTFIVVETKSAAHVVPSSPFAPAKRHGPAGQRSLLLLAIGIRPPMIKNALLPRPQVAARCFERSAHRNTEPWDGSVATSEGMSGA